MALSLAQGRIGVACLGRRWSREQIACLPTLGFCS
jgi:hypothetical protein